MDHKILAAPLLALVLLTSCIKLDKLFQTDYNTASLRIPGSVESIEFHDSRTVISQGPDISLPVFSKPNQLIQYYPQFNETHKRIVSDLINRNFRPGSLRGYHVDVEIIDGVKQFSATFSQETERVKIRLRITLSNAAGSMETEAWGDYYVSSADAKYKRFEELYRRTLQAVTYEGLKDIKSKYFTTYSSSVKPRE